MISYDTFVEALVFCVESGYTQIRPFRCAEQLYAPLRAAHIQMFSTTENRGQKRVRHSEFRLRRRIYKVGLSWTETDWQRYVNAATWNTMHKHIQIMLESNRQECDTPNSDLFPQPICLKQTNILLSDLNR
ncbi:Hypothetical_protein [Hexamita inflata]|uniref:Hypothetical_protein n=1 Tax=Hexamita inflata TaxID=28002 RepID=A0AA86NQ79_9EUKA|nr:Hypothetical protein HINF_LOCUS11392 [Hexamita inflata]